MQSSGDSLWRHVFILAAPLQNISCTDALREQVNATLKDIFFVQESLCHVPPQQDHACCCLFLLHSLLYHAVFHPNCPTVSLNAIAGNCLFSLLLCSLDPSLRLALHWQVCSQCDASFCCAMLCDAKSPAGGQQPSFMLHYSDRRPLFIFSFLFLFLPLSPYPFLHLSTISKSPI